MAEPQTYIRDESQRKVSGIVVVETGDEGVRVIENRDDTGWSFPFWMPDREFKTNTHGDDVSRVGLLSDEKFEQVMSLAKSMEA